MPVLISIAIVYVLNILSIWCYILEKKAVLGFFFMLTLAYCFYSGWYYFVLYFFASGVNMYAYYGWLKMRLWLKKDTTND